MTTVARVRLWGKTVGAVALEDGARFAAFQYHREFLKRRLEVAPLMMPLRRDTYRFPNLPIASFHGLPGLLADSLPDRYGNALIDAWLATQGRSPGEFNVIERLCYVGTRGMGALEFLPAMGPRARHSTTVHVDALVELASRILTHRTDWRTSLAGPKADKGLREILRVGTSAGGARAKAVIAWNRRTNEVRSGQVVAGDGFEYWLLKFDGVAGNRDRDLDDPQGFGAIEFAYSRMAAAAGDAHVRMPAVRGAWPAPLHDATVRSRPGRWQAAPAIAGCPRALRLQRRPARTRTKRRFLMIRQLGLSMADMEEQFRRMAFNVVASNQDDHVKNIAFLMDKRGRVVARAGIRRDLQLQPVRTVDVRHQMSLNGKQDNFTVADFRAVARVASMKRGRADAILHQVTAAAERWDEFAAEASVMPSLRDSVRRNLRLTIPMG